MNTAPLTCATRGNMKMSEGSAFRCLLINVYYSFSPLRALTQVINEHNTQKVVVVLLFISAFFS